MRLLGKFDNALHAGRFTDFLLTQHITAKVESDGDQFAVWVRDEQSIDLARDFYNGFLQAPDDPKYLDAATTARGMRRDEEQRQRDIEKKTIDVRKRWAQPTLSQCRVTLFLMVTAVAVTVLSDFGKNEIFLKLALTGGALETLLSGQVWRLVTPIFLHMGWLHLLFNLYWTYQFGLLLETRLGSRMMILLVLIIAIASNLGQFYVSGPFFGGLSGVNYGFFGYLWIKSRLEPGAGWNMPESLVIFFLLWLVLCAVGLFGPVANTAHFVGLLAGIAVAGAPRLLRR